MKTGASIIANLPAEIRDELNLRLSDGEEEIELVAWLNSQPEVVEVVNQFFDGTPIAEHNLSEWRQRGYQKWLAHRNLIDESNALSANTAGIAATGINCDKLLLTLTAAYAAMIQNWIITPGEQMLYQLAVYKNLTNGVIALQRAELQKVRLEIAREHLELLREKRLNKSKDSSTPSPQTVGSDPGKSRALQEECRSRDCGIIELRHSSYSAEADSQRPESPATTESSPKMEGRAPSLPGAEIPSPPNNAATAAAENAPVIPERDETPESAPANPAPPPAIDYEFWRALRSPTFAGVPTGGPSRQKPHAVGPSSPRAALPQTGPTPAPQLKPNTPPPAHPRATHSAPTPTRPFAPNQVRPRNPNTTITAIRPVPPLMRHNTPIPVAR